MKNMTPFEQMLQDHLQETAGHINPSPDVQQSLRAQLSIVGQKEKKSMKQFPIKRTLIIAAALCMATVSAFALGKPAMLMSSSSLGSTYHEMPAADTLSKKLGVTPKTLESFSNGFIFHSANIDTTVSADADGNKLGSFKELYVDYDLPNSTDGSDLFMTAHQVTALTGEDTDIPQQTVAYGELTLNYSAHDNKFLPPDYEMTEEDKADEASGKYVFSYGSAAVEINHFQSVQWVENDIAYLLMARDGNITGDELITLAKEVIDQ